MLQRIRPFFYSVLLLLLIPSVYARESIFQMFTKLFDGIPGPVTGKIILFFLVFFVFWLIANVVHKSEGRERSIVAIIALLLAFISTIAIPNEVVTTIMQEYSFIISFVLMIFPIAIVIGLFVFMHTLHKKLGHNRSTAIAGLFISLVALVITSMISNSLSTLSEAQNIEWLGWSLSIIDVIIVFLILYMGYFALQVFSGPRDSNAPISESRGGKMLGNLFNRMKRDSNRETRINLLEDGTEKDIDATTRKLEAEHLNEVSELGRLGEHLQGYTLPYFSSVQNYNNEGRIPVSEEISRLRLFNKKLRAIHEHVKNFFRADIILDHKLVKQFKKEKIIIRKLRRDENRIARASRRNGDTQEVYEAKLIGDNERIDSAHEAEGFITLQEELDALESLEDTLTHELNEHIIIVLDEFIKNNVLVISKMQRIDNNFIRVARNKIESLVQSCHKLVETERQIISMSENIHKAIGALENANTHQQQESSRLTQTQYRHRHGSNSR